MSKVKYSDGSSFHTLTVDSVSDTHHEAQQIYKNGTTVYFKLGNWTCSASHLLWIHGVWCQGWNGTVDQPIQFTISAVASDGTQSWGGEGFSAVLSTTACSNNSTTYGANKLIVVKNSTTNFDIWLYIGNNQYYRILYDYKVSGGTFTPSNTYSTTAPSGTILTTAAVSQCGLSIT